MIAVYAILGFVAVQRMAELFYAGRNTRELLARNGIEIAPEQHAYFIALHLTWLAFIYAFASVPPIWPLVGLFFALQVVRVWIILTLGPFWTTRIITVPGAPLVRRGPYRWIRHPNYAVVVLEMAILPLAFHEWIVAALFSVLNAVLLTLRVREEDRALAERRRVL